MKITSKVKLHVAVRNVQQLSYKTKTKQINNKNKQTQMKHKYCCKKNQCKSIESNQENGMN